MICLGEGSGHGNSRQVKLWEDPVSIQIPSLPGWGWHIPHCYIWLWKMMHHLSWLSKCELSFCHFAKRYICLHPNSFIIHPLLPSPLAIPLGSTFGRREMIETKVRLELQKKKIWTSVKGRQEEYYWGLQRLSCERAKLKLIFLSL